MKKAVRALSCVVRRKVLAVHLLFAPFAVNVEWHAVMAYVVGILELDLIRYV